MVTVENLQPGDKVTLPGRNMAGVFIVQVAHPYYPGLMLVIWRLSDGSLSFDALSSKQEVGELTPATEKQRAYRLLDALKEEAVT